MQKSLVKEIVPASFYDFIATARLPVLVEIYGPDCMPCKYLEPILAEFATDYHGKIIISKINGDLDTFLMQELKIMVYPTFLLYVKGQLHTRYDGVIGSQQLLAVLESVR